MITSTMLKVNQSIRITEHPDKEHNVLCSYDSPSVQGKSYINNVLQKKIECELNIEIDVI